MADPPGSTRSSCRQRVDLRARERRPQLAGTTVRFRAGFAYIDGHLSDGTTQPLCRLRYIGYAGQWGFAIHPAGKDGYPDSVPPGGRPTGSPEEALDRACGLYLDDPTAWT